LTIPHETFIIESNRLVYRGFHEKRGCPVLKNSNKIYIWVAVFSAIAAVVSIAVSAVLFFEKKKKDEEDLEHYLDCSIQ